MSKKIPVIMLISLVVLVPVIRCAYFFDSYLLKLWLTQLFVSVLFVYFAYQILIKGQKFYCYRNIGLAILGYLLINIYSWVRITPPHRSPAVFVLAGLMVYAALCYLTAQYLRGEKIHIIAASLWIVTSAGICVCSIMQHSEHKLVMGTLGNPNFLASHIVISIPVTIALSLFLSKQNKIFLSLGTGFVLLFLTTLYITHARAGWLGAIFALVSFLITSFVKKGKRLILTIALLAFMICMAVAPWGMRFILRQFEGDVRFPIWQGTTYMISERPLFGWGKGAYFIFYPQFRVQEYWFVRDPKDLTVHAHNEYLQIFAETGIIGLIFFMLIVYFIIGLGIKRADRIKRPKNYILTGLIAAVIGLLVQNIFCNNLQMPSSAIFLWIMFGLIMSYDGRLRILSGIKKGFMYIVISFLLISICLSNYCTLVKPVVAQFLFKKGTEYREREQWGQAIAEYAKAISWNPFDIEMHYRAAFAYTMNNDYEKAIKEYDKVIYYALSYGSVYRNKGMVYMKMKKNKEAEKAFIQQLRINENDIIAYVNLEKTRRTNSE